MSTLSRLSEVSEVVADTGDFETIKQFKPNDATTNPSLIYAAIQKAAYSHLLDSALKYAECKGRPGDVDLVYDKLCVLFGKEILKVVPGYVSTEVDARLTFNTAATIEKARLLISMYEEEGIPKSRILIKIASSWEGINACRVLQSEGIQCNMTLIFNFVQALAAANAGAFLISPFVGRIRDWYMKRDGLKEAYPSLSDPGVQSVREIYSYFKSHGVRTVVMGASFRSTDELLGLAGCDKLTISPSLLEQLRTSSSELPYAPLHPSGEVEGPAREVSESEFRWSLNDDPMACDLLSGGIRAFGVDTLKTLEFIRQKL